jgi:hypothetical protein
MTVSFKSATFTTFCLSEVSGDSWSLEVRKEHHGGVFLICKFLKYLSRDVNPHKS